MSKATEESSRKPGRKSPALKINLEYEGCAWLDYLFKKAVEKGRKEWMRKKELARIARLPEEHSRRRSFTRHRALCLCSHTVAGSMTASR